MHQPTKIQQNRACKTEFLTIQHILPAVFGEIFSLIFLQGEWTELYQVIAINRLIIGVPEFVFDVRRISLLLHFKTRATRRRLRVENRNHFFYFLPPPV